MKYSILLLALSFQARAHSFIPSQVACQTEDTKTLTAADKHTFRSFEPHARASVVGRFVSFEDADVENGETASHALLVQDERSFPTDYLRLTIPDAGFVRCLKLIPGRVRVGYIQTQEGGAMRAVYAEAITETQNSRR